jgi:hypothetical protein
MKFGEKEGRVLSTGLEVVQELEIFRDVVRLDDT